MEHDGDGYTNCNLYAQNDGKEDGRVGNWRTSRDHLNYSIVKIGQNTEKSPGDLRRLVVTQTPVKDHQLTLVSKTRKENNNNNNTDNNNDNNNNNNSLLFSSHNLEGR